MLLTPFTPLSNPYIRNFKFPLFYLLRVVVLVVS
nr:MAG TPA: hypothetical protein [Caudoviricetes sp.]